MIKKLIGEFQLLTFSCSCAQNWLSSNGNRFDARARRTELPLDWHLHLMQLRSCLKNSLIYLSLSAAKRGFEVSLVNGIRYLKCILIDSKSFTFIALAYFWSRPCFLKLSNLPLFPTYFLDIFRNFGMWSYLLLWHLAAIDLCSHCSGMSWILRMSCISDLDEVILSSFASTASVI